MTNVLLIVVGIVLTVGTAIFVAAEFSLVALDQASVRQRVEAGEKRFRTVLRALTSLSTQLSGAQVGITLTTILLGYTTQVALNDVFAQWFGNLGLAAALSIALAATLAAVVVNAFSMLFGELIPKNLALADPLRTARLVTPVQVAFTWLFGPIVRALNGAANAILRRMHIEPREEISSARSASELTALVRHSAEEGTLDTGTADLLANSISLELLSAVDVMTDRGRVASLPEDASAADVVDLARQTGHSRFPIVGANSDDIVGLVNLRGAVAVPFERRRDVSVRSSSLSIEPARVPETMRLAPLLVELRDQGMQMAVVVDEYGGTAGVVTLEDVVEEIVGEVSDEHDRRRRGIRKVGQGSYLVPGTLRPDELLARTGISLPEGGPYETLGGLVMSELGQIPTQGQQLTVAGVDLEIKGMDRRRVTQILVTAHPSDDEAVAQS